MSSSRFLAPAIVASLCLAPATRAAADAGDFVAGAIVGGILGHATAQPRRVIHTTTTPHRTYRSQRSTIPATAEGRQIQSSLNYFGFDAGAVDGQLGSRSRGAISTYQAYMGYPATGQLTPFEQELLVSSYNRAQAGGYATQQVIAQTPDGTRGLLKRYRSEMAGQGATYAAQPAPFQPGAAETMVVAPMPSAPVAAPAAAPAAPAPAATEAAPVETVAAPATVPDATLPNLFGGTSRSGGSLASHCNEVSLLTSTNGGFLTEAAMGEKDADTVLSEQFCLARTYSIARGEALMRDLDATPDQVAENCSAYGEMLAPQVSALSIKEADAVLGDVQAVALRSGVPASDLEGTAEICLAAGYRTDDMDVALGSALLLATLGQKGYGELMGHHLSQGFGTAKRPDLSLAWYEMGLEASEAGQAVFAPGQPERAALLRKAAFGGEAGAQPVPEAPSPTAASLPTFSLSE